MRAALILVLITLASCSLNQKKKTEVIVIGTVHFPTNYVNADSIYRALQLVSPDLIAMEADSSVFNADFSFKKIYDENEYNAVLKYLKEAPKTNIRPIGFEGRNAYRVKTGLYAEAGFVYNVLYDLWDEGKLTKEEEILLQAYDNFWGANEVFKNETLRHINHPFVDRLIDSVNSYQYHKIKDVIVARPVFDYKIMGADKDSVTLRDYIKKWTYFEGTQRNEALSNNLQRLIKAYPGKRIVALTGFKHRSPILNDLKSKPELDIEIKDYYDYIDHE